MAYISSGGGRQQPGGINEMYVYQTAKSAKKKKQSREVGKVLGRGLVVISNHGIKKGLTVSSLVYLGALDPKFYYVCN